MMAVPFHRVEAALYRNWLTKSGLGFDTGASQFRKNADSTPALIPVHCTRN